MFVARWITIFALLTLNSPWLIQPQAAIADTSNASVFGVNSHIGTRHPNFSTLDRPLDVVDDLAVGWVREDVQWWRIEPKQGTFDWSWYDKVLEHRSSIVI